MTPHKNQTETHTFVFADLVGYTTFTSVRGDDAAADLAVAFASAARRLATLKGGEMVSVMGDAVMLRAPDAASGIRLGLALARLGRSPMLAPVRVGVHHGPAVRRGDNWYGTTVNLAARLAADSGPGEVWVSEAAWMAAGLAELHATALGRRSFRNVPEPLAVLALGSRALPDEVAA